MGLGKVLKGLVPAVAALVAGCGDTDGPAVAKTYDRGEIVDSLFFSASRQGKVLAHVHGNPFGRDERKLIDIVHGTMAEAIVGRVVAFTDNPAAVEQPGVHVIIVFGPPKAMNGRKVCEGQVPQTVPPAEQGRIDVRAVFCGDGDLLADAEGWAKRIESADDPRFRRLIFDLARKLIVDRS